MMPHYPIPFTPAVCIFEYSFSDAVTAISDNKKVHHEHKTCSELTCCVLPKCKSQRKASYQNTKQTKPQPNITNIQACSPVAHDSSMESCDLCVKYFQKKKYIYIYFLFCLFASH